jgi:hypothetical protein
MSTSFLQVIPDEELFKEASKGSGGAVGVPKNPKWMVYNRKIYL